MVEHTIRAVVTGKVQGVCFRAAAKKRADKLGLTGWVRNLPDGTVECTATGQQEVLDQFVKWLHKGPQAAEVSNVKIYEILHHSFADFSVKH